jgi:molybdopterin molybdotransferase
MNIARRFYSSNRSRKQRTFRNGFLQRANNERGVDKRVLKRAGDTGLTPRTSLKRLRSDDVLYTVGSSISCCASSKCPVQSQQLQNQTVCKMAITYEEALGKLCAVAQKHFQERNDLIETVPLLEALGRVAARDHMSPISTPPSDTSAMDGYAISSEATIEASAEKPVVFIVKGTIAAGDMPIAIVNEQENGIFPCVEIMTGAQFPESTSGPPFDTCVKIEDTISLGTSVLESGSKAQKRIAIRKPITLNTNRRFAGGDIRKRDIIILEGSVVGSRHIMALSSVGITRVAVRRKLRVAVWSTGNELREGPNISCHGSQIINSNGPYLSAALREMGVDVEYQGILKDDRNSLEAALSLAGAGSWDLIVTTGAVSKGKFDFMLPALEELQANIHFHGVAIRPGHPVLFATTNSSSGGTPLFGLPGNPIATAACFRFLVVPFLRSMLSRVFERPEAAALFTPRADLSQSSPPHLDCFRHGTVSSDNHGRRVVVLSSNQSPAVISHFARSNCWVHLPQGNPSSSLNSTVYCYSHVPSLD